MIAIVATYLTIFAAGLAPGAPVFESMPKIDVHAHYFDEMPEFVKMLDRIDMKIVVVCVFKNRPQLLETLENRAASLSKTYRPRIHFASTFDLSGIGADDYAEKTSLWLDRTFDDGAVMTKIWKEVGMAARTTDRKILLPDSEFLDPIYSLLEKRRKPLLAHFADPIEAWRPLTPGTMHYNYFSKNPEWRMHGRAGYPSHEEIMASVERILEKHPGLAVIGAHLGSLEHDLEALGRRFDRFPNFNVDVSARTPDLKSYPTETVRQFFIKYQDRILYGLDQGVYSDGKTLSLDEQRAYADRIEGWYRKDYEFYAGADLALPREVLEKFYHGNAERLLGGLK